MSYLFQNNFHVYINRKDIRNVQFGENFENSQRLLDQSTLILSFRKQDDEIICSLGLAKYL